MESLNFTTGAGSRLQPIAAAADLAVLIAFDIEAGIEIPRAAGTIQRCGHDAAILHEQQQPIVLRGMRSGNGIDANTAAGLRFLNIFPHRAARNFGHDPFARFGAAGGDTDDHPLFNANLILVWHPARVIQHRQGFWQAGRKTRLHPFTRADNRHHAIAGGNRQSQGSGSKDDRKSEHLGGSVCSCRSFAAFTLSLIPAIECRLNFTGKRAGRSMLRAFALGKELRALAKVGHEPE